jgi:hypothetical protein
MSIDAENSDKKEYDTQLLEALIKQIALLNARFEAVHETGVTLDEIVEGKL